MYLKSLTLKGFKSFAQPTTFAFERGVTCVVGPNGSGKSNVVDALAWVMGEQGAKTLRGGKMDDVIFAGTATRGPLGRAEVILTIDNADGALPIEYAEVTITRILFRNGGSEYAINGDTCRLLDVQELLSDSGLGREMHVIVGQGQLDAVLHANPEERRGFIEEAAGILKHRRRKEKTIRKLDAMQANLTRLGDLAGEIRRQLKPLGQQAEIAKEAQSIASIARDARARLLADDVFTLRAAITAATRSESERKTQRIVLQEKLDQAKLRETRIEHSQEGDAVDVARRVAFGLESVQERLRNLYSLANQRLSLLGAQVDGAGVVQGVTGQMLAEAKDEAERILATIETEQLRWNEARAVTAVSLADLAGLDEQISFQSSLIFRHDLEISKLTGQKNSAASRLAAGRDELLRQQIAANAAHDRREAAALALSELEGEIPITTSGDTDLDGVYQQAQSRLVDGEAVLERLRERLHGYERERDALAARVSALSSALDQKDGSSALVAANRDGILGLVAEHVRVTSGYEAAIAAALGTLADAVLADTLESALAAMQHSAGAKLGRVQLVVAASTLPGTLPGTPPGFPSLVTAQSVISAPAGISQLLASTLIAEDHATANQILTTLPEGFDTVVTLAGDVLSRQVVKGGSGAKISRLEMLAGRDTAISRSAEVAALLDGAKSEMKEQRGRLELAKQQSIDALAALRQFDSRLAAHTEKLSRLRAQVEAATAESDRAQRGQNLAAESVTASTAAAERASQELLISASLPRPILGAAARDGLLAELETNRELEVDARLRFETTRERARAQQSHATGLQTQLEAEREAADAAARRAIIRRRQMVSTQAVLDSLPAVLDAADRSVSAARVELSSCEALRYSQNEELAELRRGEGELRVRLSAISDDVHGLEMQVYEKKLQLSALLERAGQELGLVEEVLVAEYGAVAVDGAVAEDRVNDREVQVKRLAQAERMLAQLGRVNPLALEEFAALEQRHKFLSEQLTDLTSTRADLLTIIGEIDVKIEQIFLSAFNDTRDAFNTVFPILFPGGTGSISLTEPENLSTTGIEITVRPAGKKIERLSLLSGGERSLAAVALLVAIFKARPSPFYIMDEVEAALDDANLGRLLTIFEDLRESSQLIIITHQKRTMEIADALYGVSMRADGISAVVGQRVQRATA